MTTPRSKRPTHLPSFGPRRVTLGGSGSPRLVTEEVIPKQGRPVQIELERLERFSALMAAQGWPAHVSRLAYDRIYAGERFGFAKRVGTTEELRALAGLLLQDWRATAQP